MFYVLCFIIRTADFLVILFTMVLNAKMLIVITAVG